MGTARSILGRLDDGLVRVERAAAATLFVGMGAVMFASVVQRVFSNPEGRISSALLRLCGALGLAPDPATIHGPVADVVHLVLAFFLCFVAVRTRHQLAISRRRALGLAALGTVALAAAVELVLVLFPSGLVWAPAMALSAMLWVGFLGASIATYERRHLALEMGEKLWPRALVRPLKTLSLLVAAAMVVFLLSLATLSISDHVRTWLVNHLAGNLLPTAIPRWVVLLILPYTFLVMALRFVGHAASVARGELSEAAGESEVLAAERLVGASQRPRDPEVRS